VSKVAKTGKDFKVDYFAAKIEDKITHFNVEVMENGVMVNADKYSTIGPCLEEAFKMTFDEDDIEEVKTSIITENYLIIEVKTRIIK
jgi:hypothetical protein